MHRLTLHEFRNSGYGVKSRQVLGSHLGTGFNSEQGFKEPIARRQATTPSSLSLTTNKLTKPTNSLS